MTEKFSAIALASRAVWLICALAMVLLCRRVNAEVTIVDLGGSPGNELFGAGPFSQTLNGTSVGVTLTDHASQTLGDVLSRDNDFTVTNSHIQYSHFSDSSAPRWRMLPVNGATGDLSISISNPNQAVYLYLVDVDHFGTTPDSWNLTTSGQPLVASRYLGTVDNNSEGGPDRVLGSSTASSSFGISYDPSLGVLTGSTAINNTESVSIFDISGLDSLHLSAVNASTTQFFLGVGSQLYSGVRPEDVQQKRYARYVIESLETLITYGTDRYGNTRTDDILVANLDVLTRRQPASLDQTDVSWRVGGRNGRRSPEGTNLWQDQDTLGVMKRASALTGDSTFADFADNYVDYYTTNLKNPGTGMFWWGIHQWYDVRNETFNSQNGNYHEIHAPMAGDWQALWDVNPAAVRTEIEKIWERHVIEKTGPYAGVTNRHDNAASLHAFLMSSGAFIEAFAFMESVTSGVEQQTWRDRARLLATYNRTHADPVTNLLADDVVANTPYTTGRFDEDRASSTLPGQYSFALLRAYQHNSDQVLLGDAVAFLNSWSTYAHDSVSGGFWGSLELDGTPVPGPRVASGYDSSEARGLIDIWEPYFLGYEHPLEAAQAYAWAYRIAQEQGTGAVSQNDADALLDTAQKWVAVIRSKMPNHRADGLWDYSLLPTGSFQYDDYRDQGWAENGTYADSYARLIDVFSTMFESTGDSLYLVDAQIVADEAISKLWYKGLFRGHTMKNTYENVDGVGLLMDSLLHLDSLIVVPGDFDGDGDADLDDFSYLKSGFLQVGGLSQGDANADGFVDVFDYLIWRSAFLESSPIGTLAPSLTGVPEPSSVLLAVLTGVWLVQRRRDGNDWRRSKCKD